MPTNCGRHINWSHKMSCDEQYNNLVLDVLQNGTHKSDRTGTGTISLFGRGMRFDLSDGRIPLLNSKKVFTKGIIHELVWFLRGDTNIDYLNRNGVTIWDSWADSFGDLGPVYSAMWRRWPSSSSGTFSGLKNENTHIKRDVDTRPTYFFESIGQMELGEDLVSIVARVSLYGFMDFLLVQHQDGFLEIAHPSGNNILKLKGTIGYPKRKFKISILELWAEIIKDYNTHITNGVGIHPDWLNFNNFLNDISSIPYYEEWSRNPTRYCLTTEYHDADEYGPKTTIFAPNDRYSHRREDIGVGYIDQIGNLINELKTNPFSRRLIVSAWNPDLLPDSSIAPCDNVDYGKQALPPCHTLFQFMTTPITFEKRCEIYGKTVDDDILDKSGIPRFYLSCQLYQRSADIPLGLPFNIAQYSILVHVIAKVCNMLPLEFVWQGGDCHIYQNQVELISEQVKRPNIELSNPRLIFTKDLENIDDFEFDSISIVDYHPHSAIKFPLAAI